MSDPARTPITITWIGHSTVLVEIAGVQVLTDPALTRPLAHLRRRRPAWLDAPPDQFRTALDDDGLGDLLIPLLPGGSMSIP